MFVYNVDVRHPININTQQQQKKNIKFITAYLAALGINFHENSWYCMSA